MSETTMMRLQEIVDRYDGHGDQPGCGDDACGDCVECLARAAKVSLQREIRAAYLHGVQESAQATIEKICDDHEQELPPRLQGVLWGRRHELAAEMRETTRELCEELGYPEAIDAAYDPTEKGTTPATEAAATVKQNLQVRQATVVWYDLPLPVLMGYTGLPADELDGAEFHGTNLDGAEASATFEEILASVEKMGAWGYFDRPRQEIHAWIAADCELGFAVHFLAHELAHATGLDTHGPADTDDELRAEIVGEIARHAYELAADRLAYLQANQLSSQPDQATRDRKGAAMHALVTGCADLWADLDAGERAGWVEDAERYEAMLRGGIAAEPTTTPEEEEGDE